MKKERIFWGLLFILGAFAIIAGKLGLLGGMNLVSIFLTVFLIAALVKSVVHKSIPGVLFAAAFICIVNAKLFGVTELTPWTVLGAALLGSIGCSILFHPQKEYLCHHHGEISKEIVGGENINIDTSFAGSVKYINSENFEGANINCSFGGLNVYFDRAMIPSGQAVIQLNVRFGGVELYLPKEWNVVNEVNVSLGGMEEKNRSASTGIPTVRLVGSISVSGVTLVYV